MKTKLSLLILTLVFLITSKLTAQENYTGTTFPIRSSETTPHSKEAASFIDLGKPASVWSVLTNRQTVLSYDSIANTLVFIRRGDGTTQTNGVAQSTSNIYADYSKDGGVTWTNNTMLMVDYKTDAKNDANRYPNVALLNSKKSSNPDELTVVTVNPTLGKNDNSVRSWGYTARATKKLNNTAGHVTYTASSYMSATGTGKGTPNLHLSGSGLIAVNDSTVFSAEVDFNISGNNGKDTLANRNYFIWKGVMTPADTLKWTMIKKLTPNTYFFKNPSTLKYFTGNPELTMAFGPKGKVGYLVAIGVFKPKDYPTHNNRKFYIAKTTDYGKTWNHIGYPRLERIPKIYDHLSLIKRSTERRAAPNEDFGITVDAKDSLHILCRIAGQSNEHKDSLAFYKTFPSEYRYYDITIADTSKTGFSVHFIDSAEVAPYTWGGTSSYTYNNRMNISRTNDGKKIFYFWSDNDPISAKTSSGGSFKQLSSPDAILMGRDVMTGKWAKAKVVTHNTAAEGMFTYGFVSRIAITNTGTAKFKYEVPMGYLEPATTATRTAPATAKYINDVGFNENEFTYDKPFNDTYKSLFNPERINIAVKIFPNPNTGVFTIRTGIADNYSVHVTDILGRTVLEKIANHTNSIKINMSTFKKGIYFISLHNSKGFSSSKVMIE